MHFREALAQMNRKRAVFESWLDWSDEVAEMLAARKWQEVTPDDLRLFLDMVQGDDLPHSGD